MSKVKSIFHILFLINAALHLWAIISHDELLSWFTKPLLMPLLAIVLWFYAGNLHPRARRFALIGLLFSCAGDILLMRANDYPHLFIIGLISFLLAHISYIMAFFIIKLGHKGLVQRCPLWVLPFLFYMIGFNIYLYNGVTADLRIPVILYSLVIMIMAMSALNLRGIISQQAFLWLFIGALLFLLSDSILAIGKFTTADSAQLGIWIMLTYIAGQYGIAKGIINSTNGQ
ncbi:MAG TPA: lysoplasmalogenase [Saprospiraceae bacterium]|nr:lysoplasmalogenase [Saprospiraceae bacterium]HMP26092.1 lysoplasmalogenase [Saprospiraceae bacterium]